MPQAAYCNQCGQNVFVTADGRCPQGHGPESLTSYYDASAPAPAPTPAEPPAVQGSGSGSSAKFARIVLLVIALGLLSILGCCVFGGSLLFTGDSDSSTKSQTEESSAVQESAEDDYLARLEAIENDVFEAVDALAEVYPAQSAADAIAAEDAVDVFAASYRAAVDLEPHPKYQAIHDHLVEGTRLFVEAGADHGRRGVRATRRRRGDTGRAADVRRGRPVPADVGRSRCAR